MLKGDNVDAVFNMNENETALRLKASFCFLFQAEYLCSLCKYTDICIGYRFYFMILSQLIEIVKPI